MPIAVACCVAQAEAAITLEQLRAQADKTAAAHLQYSIANDALTGLGNLQRAAYNRWQALTSLAVAYYAAGDYDRGDQYQLAAIVEQAEYDRLTALIPTKEQEVENK